MSRSLRNWSISLASWRSRSPYREISAMSMQPHPALDAPQDGALLVAPEITARLSPNEVEDFIETVRLAFGLQDACRLATPDIGLLEILR